ncbi:TIGR03032 family protein [Altererythrobacter xixiisoli]|uniref:TIGR03032 family protein n=1 Tax=Croceibacterium xixiisoli TaxID=1476466 RepID=A0A6I4U099_9SPHN|nr:TIGR03032 family protein [Croceibacterium xixiisoli]MXP00752.1 TIGR03032 family protein [Croceibacterium xixiisoli]
MAHAENAGAIPPKVDFIVSPGLPKWLQQHSTSFGFTSYQTGQLFLVGLMPDGGISLNQQNYSQAMGLCWDQGRLYLASKFQIWRLENMLRPGQIGNDRFDAVFVPRNAHTTGDLDVHELAVDAAGQVIFANTSFSCLATVDPVHSFRALWRPAFVSELAPGDRCHLNGLAMHDGAPAYVTVVARSDEPGKWREHRANGGMLIDIRTGNILADGFSMPHSPRVVGDKVVLLDSGRGYIVEVDIANGSRRNIAFVPGFMRGLEIHDGFAIVTLSKPRYGTFAGLDLDAELQRRGLAPWCGVVIIDLPTGQMVEWFRLEGDITELFDVAAMPSIVAPMSLGPNSNELMDTITFLP